MRLNDCPMPENDARAGRVGVTASFPVVSQFRTAADQGMLVG